MPDISFPQIQIRQQPALIGIDTDMGQFSIRQPKPDFEMKTNPAIQEIHQPAGILEIDQSKAWDALGLGPVSQTMNRVYSQAADLALQGIARIVEKGNRFAAIHMKGNPIAEIARERAFEDFPVNYVGPASYDNVDIQYTAKRPEHTYQPGSVDIATNPNRPEIYYTRGKLDIYMKQYNQLEIIPPQINVKL